MMFLLMHANANKQVVLSTCAFCSLSSYCHYGAMRCDNHYHNIVVAGVLVVVTVTVINDREAVMQCVGCNDPILVDQLSTHISKSSS